MENMVPTLQYASSNKEGRKRKMCKRLAVLLMAGSSILSNRSFLTKIGADGFELERKGMPVWDIGYEFDTTKGSYGLQTTLTAGNLRVTGRAGYEANYVLTRKPRFSSGCMVNKVTNYDSYTTVDTVFSNWVSIPHQDIDLSR